jgi:hypothetical protein
MDAWLCARDPVAELAVEHRVVAEGAAEVVVETHRRAAGAAPVSLGTSRYRRLGPG